MIGIKKGASRAHTIRDCLQNEIVLAKATFEFLTSAPHFSQEKRIRPPKIHIAVKISSNTTKLIF